MKRVDTKSNPQVRELPKSREKSRAKSEEKEVIPVLAKSKTSLEHKAWSQNPSQVRERPKANAKSEQKEEIPVPAKSKHRSRAKSVEPESIHV